MSTNGEGNGPRPSKVVLGDALAELRQREAQLAHVSDELTEVRQSIKALTKLTGEDHPRPTAVRFEPTGSDDA